jgi:hypothetical protein
MSTAKALTANSAKNNAALSGSSAEFIAVARFVSPAVEAQTINGTLKGVAWTNTDSVTTDGTIAIAAKLVKPDGTDRGVLLAVSASDDVSTAPPEIITGDRTRIYQDASENTDLTLSSVTAQEGDYIVVEIGFREVTTNTSGTVSTRIGDTGEDFAYASNGTIDNGNSVWIEFSDTITFVSDWEPAVGDDYADSIDNLLNPLPTGYFLRVFSTYSPTDSTSVYNTNLWGGGGALLDWTGIAWHDTGGTQTHTSVTNGRSVAITKRHCIATHHGGDPTNGTLHFIQQDGTLVSRGIAGAISGIGNSAGGIVSGGGARFIVYYLDEDLPNEITTYPILCDPYQDFSGVAFIKFGPTDGGDGGKAFISTFNRFYYAMYPNQTSPNAINTFKHLELLVPSTELRNVYWSRSVPGHSGSPIFALVGSQLIYVTNVIDGTTGDGGITSGHDATGPVTWWSLGLIDKACRDLDTANTGYMPIWYNRSRNAGARALTVGRNQE